MTIRRKLSVSVAIVVVLFAGAVAVPLTGMTELLSQLRAAQRANDHLQLAYELHLLGRNVQSAGMNISMMGGEMVMADTQERLSRLEEQYGSYRDQLESIPATDEQQQYVETILEHLDRFFQIVETDAGGRITGDTEVPARYLDRTEVAENRTLEETFRVLTDSIAARAAARSEATREAAMVRLRYTAAAALIATVATLIVGVLITRAVSGPIRRTNKLLKDLVDGGGDLNAKLTVGTNDEIAEFAAHFNEFTEKLRGIVEEVKEQTYEGASVGDHLSSSMNESSSAVAQISAHVQSIRDQLATLDEHIDRSNRTLSQMNDRLETFGSRVNRQSDAVQESSANIEQIGSSLTSLANITQEREKTARTLVELTEIGEKAVQQTNQTIADAADQASEISRLVEIVNDISSQTNLLAMNASIEAAHAGEQGKGFAVVADEIRSLAESTSENARDITQTLNSTVEKINSGLSASRESGEAFERIKHEVHAVSESVESLASGISQLSTSSDEIVQAVQVLREVNEHVSADAKEFQSSVAELTGEVNEVRDVSANVLQGIEEVTSGAQDIANSINEINEVSEKNRRLLLQIEENVARFRSESSAET